MKRLSLNKASRILSSLAGAWALTWLQFNMFGGNWLPLDSCCWCLLGLASIPFLIAVFLGALVHVAMRLFQRQLSVGGFLPLLIVIVGFLFGYRFPSKPAVTFWLHRGEFIASAESAVRECEWRCFDELPSASFYDHAVVRGSESGPIVIDFTSGNFYLPQLVFISTDNPEDCASCSAFGIVVERLEPQWYVCWTDWD